MYIYNPLSISDSINSSPQNVPTEQQPTEAAKQNESTLEENTAQEEIQKLLGINPSEENKSKINFHKELNITWSKWMREGLPEKNKKHILETYSRTEEFYTEAPKVNTDILPLLTDIAKKRDQHLSDTQKCVGTAISALGAAISMIIDNPEDELDHEKFFDYLSHVGQMLTDVFHQQSLTRKAFITPLLNKSLKPTLDTTVSDEWLYSEKFRDLVKEAKTIEKAVTGIKRQDNSNKNTTISRSQGNRKGPPANWKQVGNYYRRPWFRFKPRIQGAKHPQRKTTSQSSKTTQSSSKK